MAPLHKTSPEAILKVAGVEIGKAVFGKNACPVRERRLEDEVGDAPAQIAVRVNTVCAGVRLANTSRQIPIEPVRQERTAYRTKVSDKAVG